MNLVDLIFSLLIVFAMLRGYAKGLLGTVAGYVGPVLAFMVAADWSDPARDYIAAVLEAPDIFLDILAPVVVFILVLLAVRLAAALLAGTLGIGRSLPSRILAGTAGALVSALVLGAFVLLVRELRPVERVRVDDAAEVIARPLEDMLLGLDRRLSESLLAPPLAELASAVVSEALARSEHSPFLKREEVEAATRKAAEAAAEAVGGIPAGASPPERPRNGTAR